MSTIATEIAPVITAQPSANPIIRCSSLQKWYGAVHALKDVDFHAERGEVIGLVSTTVPANRR